jgi:hypothetical protein
MISTYSIPTTIYIERFDFMPRASDEYYKALPDKLGEGVSPYIYIERDDGYVCIGRNHHPLPSPHTPLSRAGALTPKQYRRIEELGQLADKDDQGVLLQVLT